MNESETVEAVAIRKLVADAVQHWQRRTRADVPSVLPRGFAGRPTYLLYSDREQPQGRPAYRDRDGLPWRLEYDARGRALWVVHPSAGTEWLLACEAAAAAIENDPDALGGFVYEVVRRRLAGLQRDERRHGLTGEYAGARRAARSLEELPDEPVDASVGRVPWAGDDEDAADGLEASHALQAYERAAEDDSEALAAAIERLPDNPGKPLRALVRELLERGWDAMRPKATPGALKAFAEARGYTDRTGRAWYAEAFGRLKADLDRVGPTAVGDSRWPVSEAWSGSRSARPVGHPAWHPSGWQQAEEEFVNLDWHPGRENQWAGRWYVWSPEEIQADGLAPRDPRPYGIPREKRLGEWRSAAERAARDTPLIERGQAAAQGRRWLLMPEEFDCRPVPGIGSPGEPELSGGTGQVERLYEAGRGITPGDWQELRRKAREASAGSHGRTPERPMPERRRTVRPHRRYFDANGKRLRSPGLSPQAEAPSRENGYGWLLTSNGERPARRKMAA